MSDQNYPLINQSSPLEMFCLGPHIEIYEILPEQNISFPKQMRMFSPNKFMPTSQKEN